MVGICKCSLFLTVLVLEMYLMEVIFNLFLNHTRIAEEETAVVCPVIDVIDWNTFEYLGNAGEPQIGGFDWRLVFTWHATPEREQKRRKSKTDVIRLIFLHLMKLRMLQVLVNSFLKCQVLKNT